MKAYRNVEIVSGKNAIAVKVCTMLDKEQGIFSNTCPNCEGAVGHQNICNGDCGKVIAFHEIKKSYNGKSFPKEQIDQLKSLEQQITVIGQMPIGDIDIRTIGEGYYLLPRKLEPKKKHSPESTQPYVALVKALEQTKTAIQIKYTLSGKEKLGILIANNGLIVLKNVTYDEQLRVCDEEPNFAVSPTDIKKAKNFITALKTTDLTTIENEYAKSIEELIAGKIPQIVETRQSEGMNFFD